MPGLCLAGESPEIQGFSLLQKTLSSILWQKVVQQPQQTTTSLEKPATKREEKKLRITEWLGREQKYTKKKKMREEREKRNGREIEWKKNETWECKKYFFKKDKEGGEEGYS